MCILFLNILFIILIYIYNFENISTFISESFKYKINKKCNTNIYLFYLIDLQPRPKDMRKSQEHCSRVIWSSRCRFLKPEWRDVEIRQPTASVKKVKVTMTSNQIKCTDLAEPWPTWQLRWPAGHPACWGWSWGGWRCRAGCCRSRRRWCSARWPSAGRASWEWVEACTWVKESEPQLVEEESARAGCSGLNASTSWFCALQRRKPGWTRRRVKCNEEKWWRGDRSNLTN